MRDFWLRSPIYIVICVLLGFVIAGLAAQNITLKDQLQELKQEQRETRATAEDVQNATNQVKNYLRCVSLTPVENRTKELIEKCFSDDLPPQANDKKTSSNSGGSQSFLVPGQSSQPGNQATVNPPQPANNGNGGGQTGGNTNPQQNNTGGLLTPVIDPVCTNLTTRLCGTLGL